MNHSQKAPEYFQNNTSLGNLTFEHNLVIARGLYLRNQEIVKIIEKYLVQNQAKKSALKKMRMKMTMLAMRMCPWSLYPALGVAFRALVHTRNQTEAIQIKFGSLLI